MPNSSAPLWQPFGLSVDERCTHEFRLVQVLPPPDVVLLALQDTLGPQVVPAGQQKVLQFTGALAGHTPPPVPGVLPLPPLPEPGPLPPVPDVVVVVVVVVEHLPWASQV